MMNTESYQGVWFYNKDAFKKAGLGDKPPKDYDELIRFGTELKKAGYVPLATEGDVVGFGRRITWLHWTYSDQFTRSKLELYRSKPGDWNFRKGVDDVWKLDVKDPNNDHPDKVTVNTIRWWQALRDKKIGVDVPEYREQVTNLRQLLGPLTQEGWIGTADAYPLFVTQKAAMYIDVTSVLTRLSKDVAKLGADAKPFEVGGFNFPPMTTSKVEAPTRGREGSLGFYGVPKKDQKQNDLEMDFLMYFSSPEGYETYMQASLDANNPKGFLNGIPNVRNVKIPEEMVKKFESIPRIGPVWQNPMINLAPGWAGSAQQAWLGLAQQFYGDKIGIDEFISRYKAEIDKAFPEQLKVNKLADADLDTPEKRPPQR
jgi:ABC-type glycerol-3-phosphate transport system substrate-binding protein